ncbi:MAG TPA: rhomboid family intramembrane serine protease, partial [Thermoanaerobaculia bacterium]|nr:rhomboid family intramembrane serine protease [Thermoanaerobaculia bacterium]
MAFGRRTEAPGRGSGIAARLTALFGFVAAMWMVWLLDWIVPGAWSVAGHGVIPRHLSGLQGIPAAPFIHATFDHLVSNTIPFLVLGALVLLRGVGELVFVFIIAALSAGLG